MSEPIGSSAANVSEHLPRNSNDFIEQQLHQRIEKIEQLLDADAIAFSGPVYTGVDDLLRLAIEEKRKKSDRQKLVMVLTTSGGSIEVVHRIVDTLRTHYQLVDYIVPNYAYSAGTVLAMSGDAIYMDYFSRLGPIDPQVLGAGNRYVPALGYLERYQELINKAQSGKISTAEVQLLVSGFDQAELYQYEQARELSISLLKEWLVKYKFKNWSVTSGQGKRVTDKMKTARAEKIARELNNTRKWRTHGHGISKDVLINDLNLIIDDFGEDDGLSTAIRAYHDLLSDYIAKIGTRGAVHTNGQYTPFR